MEGEECPAKQRKAWDEAEQRTLRYYLYASPEPEEQKNGVISPKTANIIERSHKKTTYLITNSILIQEEKACNEVMILIINYLDKIQQSNIN